MTRIQIGALFTAALALLWLGGCAKRSGAERGGDGYCPPRYTRDDSGTPGRCKNESCGKGTPDPGEEGGKGGAHSDTQPDARRPPRAGGH